jgi:Tfp pilus assembly protein PilZ
MQDLEKRILQLLSGVPEDAVQKPYTDPQGAAVTALLVADWLESTGTDAPLASDLAMLARAMMVIVEKLGGEYLPDGVGIPGDLVHRGQAVRGQAIAELEKHLKDAEAKAWIDAVRLGIGVVDLVYDLRTLGALHTRRADVLPPEDPSLARVPTSVRAAADAIEYALRAGEKEEESQCRAKIARIWTVLAPLYEKAAAAGREHTRGAGKERAFPALPLVASHRRAQRRPLSVVPSIGSAPPPPSAQTPVIMHVPGPKAGSEPRIDTAPITPIKSEPPPPGENLVEQTIGRAEAWTESRLAIRHLLEIEVAVECEGTKRVGFTENMSTGGVFVATYLSAKQGSKVIVELTMRGVRGGETVRLAGEARWQRPSSSERWPGVGVKYDDSGPEHEARMNKLLSLRDRVL